MGGEMTDTAAHAPAPRKLSREQMLALLDGMDAHRAIVVTSVEKLDASVQRLGELAQQASASVSARG